MSACTDIGGMCVALAAPITIGNGSAENAAWLQVIVSALQIFVTGIAAWIVWRVYARQREDAKELRENEKQVVAVRLMLDILKLHSWTLATYTKINPVLRAPEGENEPDHVAFLIGWLQRDDGLPLIPDLFQLETKFYLFGPTIGTSLASLLHYYNEWKLRRIVTLQQLPGQPATNAMARAQLDSFRQIYSWMNYMVHECFDGLQRALEDQVADVPNWAHSARPLRFLDPTEMAKRRPKNVT